MRIGIMSMQRVANYGSFLQAYGLKKLIESQGHSVIFVDYKVGKPVNYVKDMKGYFKSIVREKIMDLASEWIDFLFFASEEQKYSMRFKKIYKKNFLPLLGISNKKTYHENVDTLVIGSDEVFNCLQSNPIVGFSPELFGYNNRANKLISYAASFGNTTLEGLNESNKASIISKLLKGFDSISVRDQNSFEIIKKLSGKIPSINLDPVLMYDFSNDIVVPQTPKKYIVVYAYRNRLSDSEKTAIQSFAKKERLKIIGIGGYQGFCDECFQGSPFEVLGYIKNAEFVITDTFHGTIFSVINERKFVTFIRKGHGNKYGNYEKLMDLLCRLGLEERAIFTPDSIEKNIYSDIDYETVNAIIYKQREEAKEFLKRSL